MKYKNIVNLEDKESLKKSIDLMSDFLENLDERHTPIIEEQMIIHSGIFNKNHFDEDSSRYIISRMKPAIGNHSTMELLESKGITPSRAKEMIQDAYQEAFKCGIQKGFQAPKISSEYNPYDYYVTMAMCLSDYWFSGIEDDMKYSMIAYEWMSDPDSKTTKVWDYFFK